MNIVRIAILGVALIAAALTAFLVRGLLTDSEKTTTQTQDPTTMVLVANRELEIGTRITAKDLRWQNWPVTAIADAFITQQNNPKAIEDQVGGVVRSTIYANSPVTPGRIVKTGEAGFLSAILEGGKRAYGVKISPESGAGGFILPGDRVDVLHASRKQDDETTTASTGVPDLKSRTIIENVRVLAIDQAVSDPKTAAGASSIIGKTATLELTPEQAEFLADAEVEGNITVVLRSLERRDEDKSATEREAREKAEAEAAALRAKSKSFSVIRFGLPFKYRP